MRILIGALGVALLAGCVSTEDLVQQGPAEVIATAKAPRDYAKCLTPKWQDLNPRTVATETEDGYRIRLDIDMVGTPVMALVSESTNGATARIYVRNGTWAKWVRVARSCG